jgi:hypothetical protein
MLFLGAMVDALAALIGQTRIPAAPIILPHSSPDSIGRVKLSIKPAFSLNEISRISHGRRAWALHRMRPIGRCSIPASGDVLLHAAAAGQQQPVCSAMAKPPTTRHGRIHRSEMSASAAT